MKQEKYERYDNNSLKKLPWSTILWKLWEKNSGKYLN